jgi:ATP-dependent Clp protease protease subunit
MADHVAARLLHQRILVLDRELDEDNGIILCEQLVLLASEDPRSDITLLINSPGGMVHEMLAIADLMTVVPCDVRTVALGIAASAGQFLLTAGTPGKRYALPHARVVLAPVEAEARGAIPGLILRADEVERVRLEVEQVLAAATGRTPAQVREDTARQHVLDPAAAVRYGVADEVLGRRG